MSSPPRRGLPVWKKLLFSAVATIAVLAILEGALALFGVRPVLYDEDPYVGFASQVPLFVPDTDSDGREMMVTAANKLRFFNHQSFPKEKSPGTYRIFCLGGSTTYGRPYEDGTSFCGWLRELLPHVDPSRNWELINAGGISYASYRVALLAEELIQYDPDLLIVLSGHNEFLERRTYDSIVKTPPAVRGLGAVLSRTRTYAAVKGIVDGLRSGDGDGGPAMLDGEVKALLDESIGPEEYHRDDAFRESVIDHYRYNLARIVDIARSVDAEVVLVSPASNLLDCEPFKSQHREGLGAESSKRWHALFSRARQAQSGGRWEVALKALDEAAAIDDRYAQLHYLRGRVLYELGRYAEAKEALCRARDEDICPLRAVGPMVRVVSEVAAERDVPLVDFVGLAERRSDHGLPGENLFLDHVHPTIEGNRMLALAIIEEMAQRGIVHLGPSWDEATIERVTRTVEARLDQESHAEALRNLSKVLAWAGKNEEARKLSAKAAKMDLDDAESHHRPRLTPERATTPSGP